MKIINNQNMYNIDETAAMCGFSRHTIINWYYWESKLLETGEITERFLPTFVKLEHEKGKPRYWNEADIEQLKRVKLDMRTTKHGRFSKFTNPHYVKKSQ